jgi:hypothetical protein
MKLKQNEVSQYSLTKKKKKNRECRKNPSIIFWYRPKVPDLINIFTVIFDV